MNIIIISPNFPESYWHFCDRLKKKGFNVLGIGDASYDSLSPQLKASLTEYYKTDNLEDYNQTYKAVAFFAFKYGKIDWLESNNEYWLAQDAHLRKDFNITTGVQPEELGMWKSKSSMKPIYKSAGIPSARNHKVTDLSSAKEFIEECGGYPVFCKPDVGVGASDTFKIENEEDLENFFKVKPDAPYVMEEFVFGDIYTYDAICDSKGEALFESSFRSPNVAETVNNDEETFYYILPEVPEKLRDLGRKALKAFGVRSRFVHFEFFRLTTARKGLGDVGDYVGLEVNMRPAGGFTPDMINYSHSTDVYQIWADMVSDDARLLPPSGNDKYCAFASRKDNHVHKYTEEDIYKKYGDRIVMAGRMPDIFAAAMGNQMYTALLDTQEEVAEYEAFVLGC